MYLRINIVFLKTLIDFVVHFLIAQSMKLCRELSTNDVMHAAGKTHDVFQTSSRKSPEALVAALVANSVNTRRSFWFFYCCLHSGFA